jgi:glycine hydroxymethyltransferase
LNAQALVTELLSLIRAHEEWRLRRCVNLIPSENLTSPAVRGLLSCDLGHRYTAPDGFYMGARFLDEVERVGREVASRLFGARDADLRPLSGHVAAMAALLSHVKPGGLVGMVSPQEGGYPGLSHLGLSGLLGIRTFYYPFDTEAMVIRVNEALEMLRDTEVDLMILGASFITHPHPVRAFSQLRRPLVYDGSHVLGLIAGRRFQDPLREGAELLYGSTHKSFWGPQGGLLLFANSDVAERVRAALYPSLVDNAHWNRIAALTYALIEAEAFASEYAARVVANAQALARALDELGVPVKRTIGAYTHSHQVLLKDPPGDMPERLQRASIITDRGIRLGVCEVTRRGMGPNEMEAIAHFIAEIAKGAEPEALRPGVEKLASEFTEVGFTFR